MVADVGRIVTRPAKAADRGLVEYIVDAGDIGDLHRRGVEDLLTTGDGGARVGLVLQPRIVEVKDSRGERRMVRVAAKRVIDPDKEAGQLRGDGKRTSGRAGCFEMPRFVVEELRGEHTGIRGCVGAQTRGVGGGATL